MRLNQLVVLGWTHRRSVAASAVLVASFIWAYETTFLTLAHAWSGDPQYSHGFLVPVFAVGLLWVRRYKIPISSTRPCWWGLPVLLVAVAMRLAGAYFFFDWLDEVSVLACLAGACLLLAGWQALRWAWPAVAFLYFMIPLPYRVAVSMAFPLRRIATLASTYALQTLGLMAVSEGNVILVNESRIGVAEACSGLRMLVVFFALATAVAMISRRVLWERIVIVFSAIPIALVSNIIRITATGVLHGMGKSEFANMFFHDIAGWLMMPLGLSMLWIELRLLSRLLLPPARNGPLPVGPAVVRSDRRRSKSRRTARLCDVFLSR